MISCFSFWPNCEGLYQGGVKVGWSCDLPQDSRSACETVVRKLLGNERKLEDWCYLKSLSLNKNKFYDWTGWFMHCGGKENPAVACQQCWFQWPFWFIPSILGYLREEEEHKPDPWRNPIERNHMGLHLENEVAVVETPTVVSNNPVFKIDTLFWKQAYSV